MNFKRSVILKNAILISIFSLFFISCSEDKEVDPMDPPGMTEYKIRMTDAPGNFTEVNIHIQQIRVHSDVDGWADLTTNAGIYNLLDFANGIDTLIASQNIPSGKVSQIRFVLGDSNSVVVDGVEHPLTTPSASQSGYKLLVNQHLTPGITYTVLVDFDAAQSIVLTGNGEYKLKPVLKVVAEGIDGAIKGDLDPDGIFANILAIKGTDTTGAVPDSLGKFLINGLNDGSYDVYIQPAAPYLPDTVLGVTVNKGSITDLGNILLQQ